MAVKKKFNALGKGLDALISTDDVHTEGSSTINEIKINLIDANPNQPRREFNQESLQELADSIKEIGIIQPITLRQMENGRYQIIAGERRWRASQLAGLATIPAYIRTADDENVMEMALIENIQRQDLNSVEIALAYQRLIDTYGLTQEKLSERVGKKRTTIANYLRLLKLPAPVQVALQNHEIDMGHARALLALDDPKMQIKLFRDTKIKGYSVRKVEELIKQINAYGTEKANKVDRTLPQNVIDICDELSKAVGAKVTATYKKTGGGKISIPFSDMQQLQRIQQLLAQLGE